jgi:hypothetical protein
MEVEEQATASRNLTMGDTLLPARRSKHGCAAKVIDIVASREGEEEDGRVRN